MSRVLLVDDDVELVEMLKDYLEQEGFDVTAVHDGEAGVSEALAGQYAIAVLDVMMPRLGGVEALRRIRLKSAMPVIMLTARGGDTDRIAKLRVRDSSWLENFVSRPQPQPHPLFQIIPGPVADWEIIRPNPINSPDLHK